MSGMPRHVQHAIRYGTTFSESFQTISMPILFGSVPHRVLVGQTHTNPPQFHGKFARVTKQHLPRQKSSYFERIQHSSYERMR